MSYELGQPVRDTISLTDPLGSPVDPVGGVTVTVTLPDRTTTALTAVRDAAGAYHVDYTPAVVGHHVLRWAGAGFAKIPTIVEVTPTDASALVSLEDMKDHLNIDRANTRNDVELWGHIKAASAIVNRRCGTSAPQTVTETVYSRADASGRAKLVLSQIPVQSVVSITPQVVGMPSYDVSYVTGNLPAGVVYLSNWWSFYGPLTVTYVAGRSFVPDVLQLATKIIAGSFWATQRGGGSSLPAMGGEQPSTEPGYEGLPVRALQLMDESEFYPAPPIA